MQLTDHRGPARQGRLGALEEVVGSSHPLGGLLQIRVGVNAPRNDHPPIGLDGLHPTRND